MKKYILVIILLTGTLTLAIAQGHSSGHSKKGKPHGAGMPRDTAHHKRMGMQGSLSEKRAIMLAKELSLSPEQTTKIKTLFEQQEKDLEAGWKNRTPGDSANTRKNMKALFEKNQLELRAILTHEQNAKLDTIQAARKEKFMYNREHYMRHGNGSPQRHNKKK